MANETKRISPSILKDDQDALAALKAMEDYTPATKEFTLAKIQAAGDAMAAAKEAEAQKYAEADAARDDATAAEGAFHKAILGAKNQVQAQYGDDSNEIQAMGRTKKSEIARPGPKPAPAPPTAACGGKLSPEPEPSGGDELHAVEIHRHVGLAVGVVAPRHHGAFALEGRAA